MELLLLLLLTIIILITIPWNITAQSAPSMTTTTTHSDDYSSCNRNILHHSKTPGDNGFRIKISGRPEPRKYLPRQVYTVSIRGTYPSQKFLDVLLVAVTRDAVDETNTIGDFQHLDPLQTSFSPKCPHIITTTNPSLPKEELEVLWTAPPSGTGCMEFRATILQNENVWLRDDGALTLTLCEDESEHGEFLQTIPKCCACGPAKYQMTFTSLWSPNNHPFAILQDGKELQWSNIIGSTHNHNYVMWQYGQVGSKGLHEVCQKGVSDLLEAEMTRHMPNMRTVVKTAGIDWSEEYGLHQSRWSHFSVDHQHHLLSLVTRMSPSPDWCTGVSAFNLCLPNCSWIENATVNLYPWDAGVVDDDSNSFSSDSLLTKSAKVQPIEEFKKNITPIATLKIKRLPSKLPSKDDKDVDECKDQLVTIRDNPEVNSSSVAAFPSSQESELEKPCTSWSEWSECSSSCGKGVRRREKMTSSSCDRDVTDPLIHTESCYSKCESDDCIVNNWSSWSECFCSSSHKRHPTRNRVRSFSAAKNSKSCLHVSIETTQEETCHHKYIQDCQHFWKILPEQCQLPKLEGPCSGKIRRFYFDTSTSSCSPFTYGGCRGNNNRFQTEQLCLETCIFVNVSLNVVKPSPREQCKMLTWSEWSSCSSSCGQKSFRTRSLLNPTGRQKEKCPMHRRVEKQKCLHLPKCCEMSQWSTWTSCSQQSCGLFGVQERSRQPLVVVEKSKSTHNKDDCSLDVERRTCQVVC